MDEFITLFDEVYGKIMDKYYQTIKEETIALSLTGREERYLNITYKNRSYWNLQKSLKLQNQRRHRL